jgi:uncharacterized protein YndB with AHSA1/START domain
VVEVKRRRLIAASANELWRLFDDPARLGEWFSFADRAELLEGEGLGRRQRMYGHWGKKQSEIDQQVTEYEPERRLGWRHEAERLDGKPAPKFARETRFTISLAPSGDDTEVELRSRQEPNGLLRGIVIRLFGRREVAKNLASSLDRLAARYSG